MCSKEGLVLFAEEQDSCYCAVFSLLCLSGIKVLLGRPVGPYQMYFSVSSLICLSSCGNGLN